MAVTTYAELQTAILDRLSRADITTSMAQEYIALWEADAQRELETLDMETTNAAYSITGEYVAVPTGCLSVRNFALNTTPPTPLVTMPSDMQSRVFEATDKPRYYERVGSNFRFAPVPNATYAATITYLTKVPALSGSNTTNWLLTAHPDAYLFGALSHSGEKTQDYQVTDRWGMKAKAIIDRINRQARRSRWSGPMAQYPA